MALNEANGFISALSRLALFGLLELSLCIPDILFL